MFYPLFARYCAHMLPACNTYTHMAARAAYIILNANAEKQTSCQANERITTAKILHIEFIVLNGINGRARQSKMITCNTACRHQKHKILYFGFNSMVTVSQALHMLLRLLALENVIALTGINNRLKTIYLQCTEQTSICSVFIYRIIE